MWPESVDRSLAQFLHHDHQAEIAILAVADLTNCVGPDRVQPTSCHLRAVKANPIHCTLRLRIDRQWPAVGEHLTGMAALSAEVRDLDDTTDET